MVSYWHFRFFYSGIIPRKCFFRWAIYMKVNASSTASWFVLHAENGYFGSLTPVRSPEYEFLWVSTNLGRSVRANWTWDIESNYICFKVCFSVFNDNTLVQVLCQRSPTAPGKRAFTFVSFDLANVRWRVSSPPLPPLIRLPQTGGIDYVWLRPTTHLRCKVVLLRGSEQDGGFCSRNLWIRIRGVSFLLRCLDPD